MSIDRKPGQILSIWSSKKLILNEFDYSSFQRSFRVPDSVDLDKIKATYKNGILKIKLTKKKDSITKPNRLIDIT